MASLAFFTELSVSSQLANQSYGVVSASEFRVSSMFSIASEIKAFSMFKGTVLLQQQTGDATKVNLILRPHIQNELKLPIKYVIYRGLKTLDFIDNIDLTDTDNKVKTSGSELLDAIKLIQQGRSSDEIPLEALFGNELTPNSDKNIDEFFFKDLAPTSQLFTIDCGIELGKFAVGDVGVEIILENSEFFVDVALAKEDKFVMSINSGMSAGEKKWKKDLIRHFADPAAFYELHYDIKEGIEYRDNNGDKQPATTKDLVYDEILKPFENTTRNAVYLDIRNENGYSYNYYDNYLGTTGVDDDKELKIGQTQGGITPKEYYTQGWAIHLIDITAGSGEENEVFIALRVNDNERPLLAGWNVALSPNTVIDPPLGNPSSKRVYFTDEISLLPTPIPNPLPEFTQTISFKVPNVPLKTQQLGTLVRLEYIKQLLPLTSSNKFPRINFTDYIFGPLDISMPWDKDDTIEWITTNHRTYIDATSQGYMLGKYKTTILSIDLITNEIEVFDEVPVELSKPVILEYVNSDPPTSYTPTKITFDNGKTKIVVTETITTGLQTGDQLTLTVRLDGVFDYENNKFIIKNSNYINLEVLSIGNRLQFYSIDFLNSYDVSSTIFNNPNTEVIFSNARPKAGIAGFVETGVLLEDDITNSGSSDNDRVLFYAMPTNVYINKASSKKSKFQNKGGILNKSFADALKLLLPDIEFEKTVLDITPDSVSIFSLSPKKKVKETLFLLGLTRLEWDIARAAVTTSFHQQFFKLLSTTNSKTDGDGNRYYEYELQVAGEDTDGDFQVVNTGVKVYSIDRLVYVSAEFGKRADIDTTLAMQILDDFIEQTLYHDGKDFRLEYKRPAFLSYKDFGNGNHEFYFSEEEYINISSNKFWRNYGIGETNKTLFLLDKDSPAPPDIPSYSPLTTNPHTEKSFREKIVNFKQAIDDVEDNKSKIEELLMNKGADILQFAKWRIQETGKDWTNKDGMLYITRLIMSIIIRNHPKIMQLFGKGSKNLLKLLDKFEKYSRGLEGTEKPSFDTPAINEINVLISGFDPFSSYYVLSGYKDPPYYDWQDYQSNPSGNLALALDGITTNVAENGKKAKIKAAIFPVRFREFDEKWVESFFTPYIKDNNIKMIITFSYGVDTYIYDFEIERFASNNRGGGKDNDGFSNPKTIYPKKKNNPVEFLDNKLPFTVPLNDGNKDTNMIIDNKVGLDQAFELQYYENSKSLNPKFEKTNQTTDLAHNNLIASPNEFALVPITSPDGYLDTTIYPTANSFKAVNGPGGNYLSNEIFYRVAFIREKGSNSDKMTGHIHVGYLKKASVTTDRNDMLNKIKESIINAINGF